MSFLAGMRQKRIRKKSAENSMATTLFVTFVVYEITTEFSAVRPNLYVQYMPVSLLDSTGRDNL